MHGKVVLGNRCLDVHLKLLGAALLKFHTHCSEFLAIAI